MKKMIGLVLITICFYANGQMKHKYNVSDAGTLAYSRDMKFLGVTEKEFLWLYNPVTLKLHKTFSSLKKKNILSFGFLPDNEHVVLFTSDNTVTVYHIDSEKNINEFSVDHVITSGIVVDRERVALISDKRVYVYNISSKRKLYEMAGHAKPIRSIAAFPDGSTLITGGGDGKLVFYDAATGNITRESTEHKTYIRTIDVSEGTNLLIASGDDAGNVIVQDKTGNVRFRFVGKKGWIHSVKFSWDGEHLAVGDDKGNVLIYSLKHGDTVEKISGYSSIGSISFRPDGKEFAFYEKYKSVKVWSIPLLYLPPVINIKDENDRTPPQIYLSSPKNIQDDKAKMYNDVVEIRGTLMDDSGIRSLRINGITIPLKENNNFVIYQPLAMGDNPFVVEATDINDNISIKRFTVNRRSMDGEEYDVTKARNFLFVVGINDYEYWPKLNNAVKDASDITTTLLRMYNFDFDNVTLLKDEYATRSNIYKNLRSLIEQITPQDNLLVYFSGHGYFDGLLNEGYWIPVEARLNSSGDYLSNSDLLKIIGNIDSQHTFLIADACFSGSLFSESKRGYADNVEKFKSRWGLASGRLEVVSDGAIGQNSPFTAATIAFLNENRKEKFAVSELIHYVKIKVAETSDQTPLGNPLKVLGDEGGEMVLYKRSQ